MQSQDWGGRNHEHQPLLAGEEEETPTMNITWQRLQDADDWL